MARQRVDRLLVESGRVASRALAQRLIEEGAVTFHYGDDAFTPNKASQTLPRSDSSDVHIQIEESPLRRYVSRGGLKMEGALDHTRLNVEGFRVLDIGLSTGGFTDCILQKHAEKIVGIDTGEGQLHQSLLGHDRLVSLEKTKAHEVDPSRLQTANDGKLFDLFVVDVSFISLTKVILPLLILLKPEGYILALVKPQFEVGYQFLTKRGIVKDHKKLQEVEEKIKAHFSDLNLKVRDYFESSILGGDGNREYFIFGQKN